MIRFFWQESPANGLAPHKAVGTHEVSFTQATLDHKEGQPAQLTLRVPATDGPAQIGFPSQWGSLIYEKVEKNQDNTDYEVLFYGVVKNIVEKADIQEITFVADCGIFQDQWSPIAERIKAEGSYHHDVWPNDDPETLLSALPYVLYWDLCKGTLDISHGYNGKKTWDISDQYDPKYRVVRKKTPLSRVNVSVTAEWDQTILVYVNVGKHIGDEGVIGTLTDRALESCFPRTGERFGSYFVAKSGLQPITDVRLPNEYVFSSPGEAQPDMCEGNAPSKWMVQCHWYQVTLILGCIYQQRRKEILTFQLDTAFPEGDEGENEAYLNVVLPSKFTKNDDLPLWHPRGDYEPGEHVQHEGMVYEFCGDGHDLIGGIGLHHAYEDIAPGSKTWKELPQESKWLEVLFSDTFFSKNLGKEILAHTMERAKTTLAWTMRCLEVQVRGTVQDWHAITLDDCLVLPGIDGNKEKITGKVVAYSLHVDTIKQVAYVEITGAFAPDKGEESNKKCPEKHHEDTFGSILCAWPEKEIIPHPMGQEIEDRGYFSRLELVNAQEQQLHAVYTMFEEVRLGGQWGLDSLKGKETRLKIVMKPLPSKKKSTHEITLKTLGTYSVAGAKKHALPISAKPLF